MYLEGYEDEGLVESNGSGVRGNGRESVHRSGSTTITEREESTVFSGDFGEFSSFGFSERNLS